VQFGCSLCVIFALPLHACLLCFACLEQVDERKLVCVWFMEKLLCSQLVPGTNKQFLGLVLTAQSPWHLPNQSHTQANHQHVLFEWRLLADIALQALTLYLLQAATKWLSDRRHTACA
jgi:hypothetical protein